MADTTIATTESIDIVLPEICIWDGTAMLLDDDGSITGWGFPVWYCPLCGDAYPVD